MVNEKRAVPAIATEANEREKTCVELVKKHFESRIEDIKQLWGTFQDNPDADVDGLGTLNEYGLSFDYVAAGTFKEQDVGYFRWQLSWGGPSDEFRYYADPELNLSTLDYWFLDWFDGAPLMVERDSDAWHTLHDIWVMWKDCEVLTCQLQKAHKE